MSYCSLSFCQESESAVLVSGLISSGGLSKQSGLPQCGAEGVSLTRPKIERKEHQQDAKQ
jgi:hypothetical protein